MPDQREEVDWEITSDGLYIATRSFLIRRGYCCANRCRNCPYINWRLHHDWQPLPAERVQQIRVSARAVEGAHALLRYHEEQVGDTQEENEYHRLMIEHYQHLLSCWERNIKRR